MDKKTILLLIVTLAVVVLVGKMLLFSDYKKNLLITPLTNHQPTNQTLPSQTLKTYSDAAGFSFNYPDNLSLVRNELLDTAAYADIQLSAKGVDGSLNLKIADSKLASLDEWVKSNKVASESATEAKLGTLLARQIQLRDKLLLGALNQGILFTLEIPQTDFWQKVSQKVAADFSFAPPQLEGSTSGNTSTEDVIFEGEEVVE